MGSIRLAMIYGVLGILFIGTATVNAQESTELPQFKSGASINIGLAADFKVLDQRVNAIYDVVESDSSHIVWKFAGTTGIWHSYLRMEGYWLRALLDLIWPLRICWQKN